MTDPIVDQLERGENCKYLLGCLFGIKEIDNKCYQYISGQDEKVRNQDIVNYLGKDKSTVHRSLKRLEEAGLIEKEKETYDRGGYEYHYYQRDVRKVRDEMEVTIDKWRDMVDRLLNEFEEEFEN
jgi:predicted transcriptional regulator